MRLPPIEPVAGQDVSASWMRKFVGYVRAITPISGPWLKASVTPRGTILRVDIPEPKKTPHTPTPHPFLVKLGRHLVYDNLETGVPREEGHCWIVYLPTIDHLVMYGKEYIEIRYASARRPGDDWHEISGWPAPDDGEQHLWLNIYDDASGKHADLDKEGDGNAEYSVHIAEMHYDANAGQASVYQSVVGAIMLCDASRHQCDCCHCHDDSSESGSGSSGADGQDL